MTTTVPAVPVTRRSPGDPQVDLTSFALIHRAIRSGTRMLADAVDGIARDDVCDADRRRGIVQFARAVLHEIHLHHAREDDVLWPVIVASAGSAVDLGPLTDDHVALAAVLARVDEALPLFARSASAGAPLLAPALTELADLLAEHIAEEEARVFPVLREHVSTADFERCERQFRKGTTPGALLFLVPWIADSCSPAERAALLRDAGLPMRLVLALGRRRYGRRRDAVLGS